MASKIELVQTLVGAIVNGKVLCAPGRDGAAVSVGVYQEAVPKGVKYAVIRRGDADVFGSALSAAVHFIALVGVLEPICELEELPVLETVSAPWPLR